MHSRNTLSCSHVVTHTVLVHHTTHHNVESISILLYSDRTFLHIVHVDNRRRDFHRLALIDHTQTFHTPQPTPLATVARAFISQPRRHTPYFTHTIITPKSPRLQNHSILFVNVTSSRAVATLSRHLFSHRHVTPTHHTAFFPR